MKSISRQTRLLTALLLSLSAVVAQAEESGGATSAPTRPKGVVGKVEHALGVAATATAHGVQRGASATAHGIKRGAEATAHGIERGAKAVDRGAHKVAKKISGQGSADNAGAKK